MSSRYNAISADQPPASDWISRAFALAASFNSGLAYVRRTRRIGNAMRFAGGNGMARVTVVLAELGRVALVELEGTAVQ